MNININDTLIDGIYNNALPFLLEGVSIEHQEKLKSSYKDYLRMNYENTLEPGDDLNQVINVFSITEVKKWHNKPQEYKLAQVVEDKILNRIKEISGFAYQQAQRKLGCIMSNIEYIPQITAEQVTSYINELNALLEQITAHNKTLATTYVSEGILDFQYASNLNENMSLRTSKLM